MKPRTLVTMLLLICSGILHAQQAGPAAIATAQQDSALSRYIRSKHLSEEEALSYRRLLQEMNAAQKNPVQAQPATPTSNARKTTGHSNNTLDSSSTCYNSDFESSAPGTYTAANAIAGWIISSRNVNTCASTVPWQPGSKEFSIRTTPLSMPGLGTLPASPLGGSRVAQLNNFIAGGLQTMITKTLSVNQNNYRFVYAIAGVMQDGSHMCCEQSSLHIRINNSPCGEYYAYASGMGCQSPPAPGFSLNTQQIYYSGWQTDTLNLFAYIGTTVGINFIAADCIFAGHYASMFVDADCDASPITCSDPGSMQNTGVSFCPGSTVAVIQGPQSAGIKTYNWLVPTGTLSAQQASASVLTVTNPVPGATYTLQLTAQGICGYLTTTYVLAFTQTSINCISSSPSCLTDASGSASVVTKGSGSGYQYTWTSLTQTITGTSPVVTGLAPGNYSVQVSAINSASCGLASGTFVVNPYNGTAPVFTVSPDSSLICAGTQVTLTAQGSATSYTWAGGPHSPVLVVKPASSVIYTVTGSATGMPCKNTATVSVEVNSPSVSLAASASVVCAGTNVTLSASGAQTYSWSVGKNGSSVIEKITATKTCSIIGATVLKGLSCSTAAFITVTALPLPVVFVSGPPLICVGDSAVYKGTGASTYSWTNGATTSTLQAGTAVAGLYTICTTGTDNNGCSSTGCLPVEMALCTGVKEYSNQQGLWVYPNPSKGKITIRVSSDAYVQVFNELMQLVYDVKTSQASDRTVEAALPPGVYFVLVRGYRPVKLIVD